MRMKTRTGTGTGTNHCSTAECSAGLWLKYRRSRQLVNSKNSELVELVELVGPVVLVVLGVMLMPNAQWLMPNA
ncbi:hypothetical protein AWZ03_014649 [Drosophila navojoa]|uniref:Uncharacterized protein n=1 Tax=Drosophila navojoa TaxID=7232 RepID=A0A484ARG0_DRONA|nr:hypothetical protein AWZ03_014649 [Drosophila navojoa]